jgi:sulfate transport system ATP-binding protein/putative spermidine/putrescine transport system ATP-binding protein
MSLIKNLSVDYGDFKLDIPEWELLDVGTTALLGPSGSGKSTIVRILLGLLPCPKLIWEFKGRDLASLAIGQRNLGVVFQNYELFPHMSALENIFFAAEVRKVDPPKAKKTFESLVETLSLQKCLKTKAHVLSGGEKQRVALARAIMGEPQFLFLDEPFSALDVSLRSEARALVKKVLATQNIPALMITHDEEDVKDLAQAVVRIDQGRLVL